ncbi:MAG TPA: DUF5710 domain-containing protein [Noviherbaspirillum sp.]|nr:DUF5710 domain-containing protein [Noviherbaspirillum sp.]
METSLNNEAFAHRIAIAHRFADRITAGDAIFISDTAPITETPYTVSNGEKRNFSGANAFMLLQVMKDRQWSDARFFTADQITQSGWTLNPDAKRISLQFLTSIGADGLPSEKPEVKRFSVFNASEIKGVPNLDVRRIATLEDVAKAAASEGFLVGDRGLDVALEQWLMSLAGSNSSSLPVRLAATLLQIQAGVPFVGSNANEGATQWAQDLRENPMSFFESAQQAHVMAASVMRVIQLSSAERQAEEVLKKAAAGVEGEVTKIRTGKGVAMVRKPSQRVEEMFQERAAVLSVPYADKDRARQLGAVFYSPQSIWFVPKGVPLEPFKEWNVRTQSLGLVASVQTILDSFGKAMEEVGLEVPAEIKADGEWHNVKVKGKGYNKSGAYILNLTGAKDGGPIGTINNKKSGEQFTWKYDGPLLTPEQRARLQAEAKEREARAEREIAAAQDTAAMHAKEIWGLGTSADSHGYVVKKGISAEGLRQVPGSVLLRYDEFKGESGKSAIRATEMYLIVPMSNEAGELRAIQAISQDGSVKSFMRGAQKKGTMFIVGAESLAALKATPVAAVAYSEGVATGKSVRAGSGIPVFVCFDAGNLETVVPLTAPMLPAQTLRALAVDNDQFFVERALGFLAFNVGLNPHAKNGETVAVENGRYVRTVELGEMKVDGQWHQAPTGSYCASLVYEDGGVLVKSVAVEAVPTGGRKIRGTFENRGVAAGKAAIVAVNDLVANGKVAEVKTIMVVPEFKDVQGRPTDFNDLEKLEGAKSVRSQLEAGGVILPVREKPVVAVAHGRVLASIER